jgi:hypothetical protein
MSRKTVIWFVLPFLAWAIFLNGCGRDLGTAQGVVEEFVDQHYVHILLEKKAGETRASFLYEGKIVSDDGSSFTRKWLILARKDADRWRVSNFTESD